MSISSVYLFIFGSPMPAPKPRARILSGAVEYPSCIARPMSAMPGAVVLQRYHDAVGTHKHVRVAAAGMDDHIDLALIHGDRHTAYDIRREAELTQFLFDLDRRLPRRR